jgi:hypothetical protein
VFYNQNELIFKISNNRDRQGPNTRREKAFLASRISRKNHALAIFALIRREKMMMFFTIGAFLYGNRSKT